MNAQVNPDVIALQVNNQSLMQKLKFAFTNKSTVVSELIQNARRSGATRVDVRYDPEYQTLTVDDDGTGINDFQNLLSVAESGWDEKVIQEDTPYGLGFLSAVYAADHVVIRSNGKELSASTESILNFESVEIKENETLLAVKPKGSRVFLTGIKLGEHYNPNLIFKGYPIPIVWNGKEIERDFALDAEDIEFFETEVGMMHLSGLNSDTFRGESETQPVLFFQGMLVWEGNYFKGSKKAIIHLNNRFNARLPDRDTINDLDECLRLVKDVMHGLWVNRIKELKEQKTDKEFCDFYTLVKQHGLVEMYNTLDYVPCDALYYCTDWPALGENTDITPIALVSEPLSRDDLSSYVVFRKFEELVTDVFEGNCKDENIPQDFAPWAVLSERCESMLVVCASNLHKNHWIFEDIKTWQSITAKSVGMVKPKVRGDNGFDDYYVHPEFCTHVEYFLDGELLFADRDTAVVLKIEDKFILCIPDDCTNGQAVRQCGRLCDEFGEWSNEIAEKYEQDLEKFIIAHRAAGSDVDLLKELMIRVGFEAFPSLHGKSFKLSLDKDGSFEIEKG